MDIKKLLITDEIAEKVVVSLREAGLTVDVSTDITPQRLIDVIKVS